MSAHREAPALPEMNAMSVPVARQRNRRLCEWICEYPPTISAVSQTTLAFTAKNTKLQSAGLGSVNDLGLDEAFIENLIANKIKNKVLITNRIETFEINVQKSSGFIIDCDEDVIYNGICDTNDKFFWNGSTSTLFIDGYLELRHECITINGSRILDESDGGKHVGVCFNYWDETDAQQEAGFFGFDPDEQCFKYLLDVSTDENGYKTGTPGNICTNTFVAENLVNNDENDLNITSTQSLDITVSESTNIISSSYTNQTSTGMILSNTGEDGINILTSSGPMEITSTDAEMNITTTNDNMQICVEGGDLDICVSGVDGEDMNITSYNESQINIISNKDSTQAILIDATEGGIDIISGGTEGEDINVYNTGGSVHIQSDEAVADAVCLKAPNGGICMEGDTNIDGDLTLTGDLVTLNSDFTVNGAEKTDYRRWFPYKTFDVMCGYWQTYRATVSGSPIFYWKKIPKEEVTYISIDIDQQQRTTSDKGYKLDKIYFAYEVENAALNAFTPIITLKTFDETNPGNSVTLSNITYTDINLTTAGLAVDEHYRGIQIDNPFYVNSDSVVNVEITLDTPATAGLNFYGMMIQFTQDVF